MKMSSWKIGDVKITSVFEVEADEVIQDIIPKATKENLASIPWLQPHFADENGHLKAQVQLFLVEVGSKRIIIDPCVGNGRSRPGWPAWDNLQTNFLETLRSSGCAPESVDMVICTHMHYDHVGWNTTLMDEKWVPTFPNSRYLFVKDEFDYWMTKPKQEMADDLNGIDDSIRPVAEAGLIDLVADDQRIRDEISLVPTPGHTPHHVSVLIKSKDQSALIVGDVLHHPCQIARPDWMSFDTDEKQALKTRLAMLKRFADTDTVIFGAHFASPVAGTLQTDGDSYKLAV